MKINKNLSNVLFDSVCIADQKNETESAGRGRTRSANVNVNAVKRRAGGIVRGRENVNESERDGIALTVI